MKVQFSDNAWEDCLFRQKNDKQILKRINELIRDIRRNHYLGVGKPEALRHNLAGWWSR